MPARKTKRGATVVKTATRPRPAAEKWLPGIPEWEAAKAAARDLSHADAVRECHFLTNQYRRMWERMASFEVNLDELLRALRAKKVPFVLTGAHGIAAWTGRPRSTHDVDILVKGGRNHARAVKAVRELYPGLEVRQFTGLVAFFVPGEKLSVVDVTYPHRADIEETLRTATWIEDRGQRYRVPTLEAALANKYGAMLTPTRDTGKRLNDAADFYQMVRHSMDEGRQPIDLGVLSALGDKVWPGGGGREILRLVEQAKAGQSPQVNPREGRFE